MWGIQAGGPCFLLRKAEGVLDCTVYHFNPPIMYIFKILTNGIEQSQILKNLSQNGRDGNPPDWDYDGNPPDWDWDGNPPDWDRDGNPPDWD